MDPLLRGTVTSSIAAVLILAVLAILISRGIEAATEYFTLSLLYLLFILAIIAFLDYRKLQLPYYKLFVISIPLGLAIVFIGLLMLTFKIFEGAYLVMLGYLAEPIGGIAPFSFYMRFNKNLGLFAYVCGAIYVLTLPLLIFKLGTIPLGIVPMIFNSLKFVGFLVILNLILERKIEEIKISKNIH